MAQEKPPDCVGGIPTTQSRGFGVVPDASFASSASFALFWMELLVEAELVKEDMVADFMQECDEIVAIVVSSINTARGNKRK